MTAKRTRAATIAYRVVGTFLIALLFWVVLGYLVIGLMGRIYGWGGHPAIPSAPLEVYFVVYLIVLPIICLAVGWKATRLIESRIKGGAPAL